MIGKNQIKLITSLRQKKNRVESGLFFAEGRKVISEFVDAGYILERLYAVDEDLPKVPRENLVPITEAELKKISVLTTPNKALAVFRIPSETTLARNGLIVALDGIRDPGNLGTIIRLCDWFGIEQLVCSKDTADCYNPKVVQATMGSLARVSVVYTDLKKYLKETDLEVFGTFMDGQNIYETQLPGEGIIVFGNEANGISAEVEIDIAGRIAIPRFGKLQKTESLNVATAAAIVLSQFRSGS